MALSKPNLSKIFYWIGCITVAALFLAIIYCWVIGQLLLWFNIITPGAVWQIFMFATVGLLEILLIHILMRLIGFSYPVKFLWYGLLIAFLLSGFGTWYVFDKADRAMITTSTEEESTKESPENTTTENTASKDGATAKVLPPTNASSPKSDADVQRLQDSLAAAKYTKDSIKNETLKYQKLVEQAVQKDSMMTRLSTDVCTEYGNISNENLSLTQLKDKYSRLSKKTYPCDFRKAGPKLAASSGKKHPKWVRPKGAPSTDGDPISGKIDPSKVVVN